MTLGKKPYRGTRDFFPKEMRIRQYLFAQMKISAEAFGYEPYDGPLLEEVELYKAKSGEELINEQIYSFTDRGEREVAIRPEMTPTLARMVSNIHKEETKPIRWYSIPNLMRYEKPQRGRLREHWQFNCDIFGSSSKNGEVEILQVIIHLLKGLGANKDHFEILLNDRAIIDTVFTKILKVDQQTSYSLYKIIDKAKKVNQEALEKMVREKVSLDQMTTKKLFSYLQLKDFSDLTNYLNENEQIEISLELNQLQNKLKNLSIDQYIRFDPTIVRGLDYYTGIVFEVFDKHPDNRRAICGGGAYANLLQIFNEPALAGVGFGLGDVTLKDFLVSHNLLPDISSQNINIFAAHQDEKAESVLAKIASQLRDQNYSVISSFDAIKMKKSFSLADKKGSSYLLFMGSDEYEKNIFQLKNLKTKEQKEFPIDNIEQAIFFLNS